jgi:hypothetical protein
VTFNSRDGIVLKGWWFAVMGADLAAVIVHGRGRNRANSDFSRELGTDKPSVVPAGILATPRRGG